jgi:hypothetical protein
LAAGLGRSGIRAFVLDLRGVRTKAALLERWREAIGAPPSTGRNWDAMEERMQDLAWDRADRYVVIVTGATGLASTAPDVWRTALGILSDAADAWTSRGTPMTVLLRGSAPPPTGD